MKKQIKKILIRLLKKIYYTFISRYIDGKIKYLNRHKNYKEYIQKQIEKTNDPEKIARWQGSEWSIKVDGFKHVFKRNDEYIKNKKKALCLGSRTGQEVHVLRTLGMEAIGIDLVEFQPYTIKGDIHDLTFEDEIFDLIFTNILDHSLYLKKFISEMERVTAKEGIIILNIQEKIFGDDYSENIINDQQSIIEMFKNCSLLMDREIKNTFDQMNREIIMKKN